MTPTGGDAAPRGGYDSTFLAVPVPLPRPRTAVTELRYVHFTVLLDTTRRLAAATGVNVDGSSLRDLGREDEWQLDPRVPVTAQAGEELYARNDLDRGHLVRRRDPVWGDPASAAQANLDTFSFPNAAPQVARFNQGEDLWSGLEDYVLDEARATGERLSVFTGPVLADDDPTYRGVQLPRLFWKVAAWTVAAERLDVSPSLAATGYVLDQGPLLDDLLASDVGVAAEPSLGAFGAFQVPLGDIAGLTGLDLGPLLAADRFPTVGAVTDPAVTDLAVTQPAGTGSSGRGRWRRLDSAETVRAGVRDAGR